MNTDGVPEATNTRDEQFRAERMLKALNTDTNISPERVLGNVYASSLAPSISLAAAYLPVFAISALAAYSVWRRRRNGSKMGKTDAYGLLKIAVPDGPHSVSLDKKTEVYINNYSGAGVEVTTDFPKLIYNAK